MPMAEAREGTRCDLLAVKAGAVPATVSGRGADQSTGATWEGWHATR